MTSRTPKSYPRLVLPETGGGWWCSLDDRRQDAGAPEREDEFPQWSRQGVPLHRRDFMKLLGASMALAGVGGCSKPADEHIVPYVHPPEAGTQDEARHYATAVSLNGYGLGVIGSNYSGRPVKLEGNPDHPASHGRTDTFTQAEILQLWDPERSKLVSRQGVGASWDDLLGEASGRLQALKARGGAGVRVLTGNITSPSLSAQLQTLQKRFPQAQVHHYEPVCDDHAVQGAELAFGRPLQTHFQIEKASRILSLEADFLDPGPDQVRYAKQFAKARKRGEQGRHDMVRLYALEACPTLTGAAADHRKSLRAAEIETVARHIAQRLGGSVEAPEKLPVSARWLDAAVEDLRQAGSTALVATGRRQPPAVHALVHWINDRLGAAGHTVTYREPVAAAARHMESLRELARDMQAGQVDTLFILDSNPVYSAPADIDFAHALAQVPLTIHLGLYADETARWCRWHVPMAQVLESWGDVRASDGTVTIQQPLVAPLYSGRTAQQLIAVANGNVTDSARELVRSHWQRQWGEEFEQRWRRALRTGLVEDTAAPTVAATVSPDLLQRLPSPTLAPRGLEIGFIPDGSIWDGRYANNGWLQELPKPMSQLTWDNAALISPITAEQLGIENEQLLELRYHGRTLRAPAWLTPGHSEGAVTLSLGYGREAGAPLASGKGFNANRLRGSEAPWFDHGLEVQRLDETYPLATTQAHHRLHDRHMIKETTLEHFLRNPLFAQHGPPGPPPTLYPGYAYEGHAWGMVVNLNTCIGCNACTIACQAENNIPVVGKEQVRLSREMHWIRVDRYYKGPIDEPETYFQPVPCMHCEHAPCEVVCPVGATLHDSEGLNVQVYNRCIGTRFCSNNCPYKVRRFNFLQYADRQSPSLKAQRNPEVTVRMRGVMEKCTYCVQRIEHARIGARREQRSLQEQDLQTACQQVCPADAIVFGDTNNPASQVSKEKAAPLDYVMLEELNTRPRTSYTAKLRNPNAALKERG